MSECVREREREEKRGSARTSESGDSEQRTSSDVARMPASQRSARASRGLSRRRVDTSRACAPIRDEREYNSVRCAVTTPFFLRWRLKVAHEQEYGNDERK